MLVLTHEAFESIIPVEKETPIYCSLGDTRFFSSVSMTFLLEQGLEIELGFVTLKNGSFLLLIGAKASALDVGERAQAVERELQVETPIVVGAVEANPGNRDNVSEQKVWMS